MADKRAYAQFDVGYLDNPKLAELLDAGHLAAILMHAASVMYCSQHLTDGRITERTMQRKIGGTAEDCERLVEAGLWHRVDHDCEFCPKIQDGTYVHDYLEHNRSSEGVKRASEKGRKAAIVRHHGQDDAPSSASGNASGMQLALVEDATGNAQRNAQSMPRKKERKKERVNTSSPLPASTEFDSFWRDYPRKIGKEAARKAFAKALKLTDFATIMEGVVSLRMEVAGKDQKFTPHAATWLNAGRWDDETDTPQQAIVPAGYAWANR